MLVQQGDDGFDMSLFDDVQGFGTLHQHAVQDLQDPLTEKEKHGVNVSKC